MFKKNFFCPFNRMTKKTTFFKIFSALMKLEELLAVHMGLKDQEHKFREQCKSDAAYLQKIIQNMEINEPQEEEVRVAEYDALKDSNHKTRLLLAKKNRAIASLIRQLDDVPGRSELTQYQRRFMELYNQGY